MKTAILLAAMLVSPLALAQGPSDCLSQANTWAGVAYQSVIDNVPNVAYSAPAPITAGMQSGNPDSLKGPIYTYPTTSQYSINEGSKPTYNFAITVQMTNDCVIYSLSTKTTEVPR